MTGVARVGRALPDGAHADGEPDMSIGVTIWYYVVLCLPGTHGNNRFGPDPIPDRPPRESSHPRWSRKWTRSLAAWSPTAARKSFRTTTAPE
jgi:hypothetical protein